MEQYIFRQKETRTVLLDKLGVVAALCEQAEREGEQEHCVLAMDRKTGEAVYELFDSCAVEEMGASTGQNRSTVPRKVSLALIQLCVKRELIPVILHTHAPNLCPEEPVIFSQKDQIFMDRFSQVAIDRGLKSPCLFLVTNGQSILLCDTSNMIRQYAGKEEPCHV